MHKRKEIRKALASIFKGISRLKKTFPNRNFTIDGRLVGDIGEIIAALEYDIIIHETSQPDYDGETSKGQRVQVKATFKNKLTFKITPEFYLGFKLFENGDYKEVYNGPGKYIYERYKQRKGIGKQLLSFPISELEKLSAEISDKQRVPGRTGEHRRKAE